MNAGVVDDSLARRHVLHGKLSQPEHAVDASFKRLIKLCGGNILNIFNGRLFARDDGQ